MRNDTLQTRRVAPLTWMAPTDASHQVLKIDIGNKQCKRLPGWFFAGPRVVDLWPPEARPVWSRDKANTAHTPPAPPPADAIVDMVAWSQAMQENTRLWVRKLGKTLAQVPYFEQMRERFARCFPDEARRELDKLLPSAEGALLFNGLPQVVLRTLGHTPLPQRGATDALFVDGTALLVWPALLVAPSCCDHALAQAVQRALSPAALLRLGEFCASPLGVTFVHALREASCDQVVMSADETVDNNLQAGLREELRIMRHASTRARLCDTGVQLQRDVAYLRDLLIDKQDVFLNAPVDLDRTLIALQEVADLAEALTLGPAPEECHDEAWELAVSERLRVAVPHLHACVGHLLQVVGHQSAMPQTLQLMSRPMP